MDFKTVSHVHTGVNTVEINTEAASTDVTEYPPPDDKPNTGMFGFLCCCVHLSYTYASSLAVINLLLVFALYF